MGHYTVLIIIPESVYEHNYMIIQKYIDRQMVRFSSSFQVPRYVIQSKSELLSQYMVYNQTHPISLTDYVYDIKDWCLNEYGDAMSTENPETLYDSYEVVGNFLSINEFNHQPKKSSAIVDCDGQCYRRFNPVNFNDICSQDEWSLIYSKILNQHPNDYVVYLDCHV